VATQPPPRQGGPVGGNVAARKGALQNQADAHDRQDRNMQKQRLAAQAQAAAQVQTTSAEGSEAEAEENIEAE
jgi:hypothetical protein